MAPRKRQTFVKSLRLLGRACSLEDLPGDNNVGQGRVRDLVRNILACEDLSEEQREPAVAAHQGYEATFAARPAHAQPPDAVAIAGEVDNQAPAVWQFPDRLQDLLDRAGEPRFGIDS